MRLQGPGWRWQSFLARPRTSAVLTIVATAVLLTLASQVVDLRAVAARLANLSPWVVAAGVACLWVHFALGAIRLALIAEPKGFPTPRIVVRLFAINLFALFTAVLLPMSAMAEIGRAALLARQIGGGLASAGVVVIVDRLLSVVWMSLLALISLPILGALGLPSSALGSLAAVASAVLIAAIAGCLASRVVSARWRLLAVVGAGAASLLASFVGRRGLAQAVLAIGLALSAGAAFHIIATGVGLTLPAMWIVAIGPTLLLLQSIPFTYVGWGAREAALVYLLTAAGYEPAAVFSASVAFGVVVTLAVLPGALVLRALVDPDGRRDPSPIGRLR